MKTILNSTIGILRRLADGSMTQDEFSHLNKSIRGAVAREIQDTSTEALAMLLPNADAILSNARNSMEEFGYAELLQEAHVKAMRKATRWKSRVRKLRRAGRRCTASLFSET